MRTNRRPAAAPSAAGIQQVIAYYQQGNLPAAGRLAEQLLQQDRGNAELFEISAVIAMQAGNAGLAVARLRQQTELQPDNALAHSNLCLAQHATGDIEAALASGRQALSLDPTLADAWNNLGNIYKSVSQLEDALVHYEKALECNPGEPELYLNAGVTSQQLGDLETAGRRYRQALGLRPGLAEAHGNLGTVLQRLGRNAEAETEFRTALRLQPGNPEFLTNLGTFMLERNQYKKAARLFNEALQKDARHTGALISLGNLYEALGDHKSAFDYWDRALELDPGNTTVLCNKGMRLYELGEQQEAISYFVRALESNPYSAKGMAGLGKALLRQGISDKAVEYIEKATRLAPWDIHVRIANAYLQTNIEDDSKAVSAWQAVIEQAPAMPAGYIGLGRQYAKLGQYDEARAQYLAAESRGATNAYLYQSWSQMEEKANNLERAEELATRAVAIDPDFPGLNILRARLARRQKDYESALNLLQQVDKDSIADKQTKARYLFELGAVLERLGQYHEAFAAYREANESKNCYVGRTYDAASDEKKSHKLKEVFNRDAWQGLGQLAESAGDITGPQPVFIVGFPRSGTSLLEQILGAHREIMPAGELLYMNIIRKRQAGLITGSQLPYPEHLADPDHPLDTGKILAMRDYYLGAVREQDIFDDNTRWFTDKLPHNAAHLGLIRLLFPNSPVIHVVRHPLNPCLSAYFSNFNPRHRYTSSLQDTARHYKIITDLVSHYREIGIDFLEVRYEDLVRDQERETRKILDYIGAPMDNACLQHYKSDRVVRTASYEQVTQKIYTTSLNRYQNYWDEVQDIIPILQATIERFGYTIEPPAARETG